MSKLRVIDLLIKIANGEEVPLIKYRGKILHWNKEKDRFEDKDGMNTLYEMDFSELNDEVEIIEDKKIEKLEKYYNDDLKEYIVETYINGVNYKEIFKSKYDEMMINKINEIIDYLEEKE